MENNHNIEELVAERDFNQLTEAEKIMVIKELGTEDAYADMRNFILAFRDEDEVEAPPQMRQNVMDAYDEQQKDSSSKKIIPLWNGKKKFYKQPLVYVLIAASLLFAVFIFLPDSNTGLKPQLAENKAKIETDKSETPVTEKPSTTESEINAQQTDKAENKKEAPSAEGTQADPAAPLETNNFEEVLESELDDTELEITEIEFKDASTSSEGVQVPAAAKKRKDEENSFAEAIGISQADQLEDISTSKILTKSAENQARTQEMKFSSLSREISSDERMESVPLVSFRVAKFKNDHYTGY